MKSPRFATRALQTAWNVLKTTLLPPVPPPAPPPITLPTVVPAVRHRCSGRESCSTTRIGCSGCIGEGAIGAVYEATHARLAGRYAIKLLLLKPTVASEEIALFAREARITSLLQHPNIVQVIDHNTTADGTEYLVMEYLAGESLAQRLVRQGAAPARHRRRDRRPDRGGAGRRPRRSRRPPRPQAGQRVPGAGRGTGRGVGQDPRLRDLEGEGHELGPPGARRDGDGHAALHGARADRGAGGGRGRARPISSRSP